jgi:hypothetical protein
VTDQAMLSFQAKSALVKLVRNGAVSSFDVDTICMPESGCVLLSRNWRSLSLICRKEAPQVENT